LPETGEQHYTDKEGGSKGPIWDKSKKKKIKSNKVLEKAAKRTTHGEEKGKTPSTAGGVAQMPPRKGKASWSL